MSRPLWNVRLAGLLHRACSNVADQIANGAKLTEALACTAKRFNGRNLGSNRRLRLTPKSLENRWYRWTKSNRDVSAFDDWRYRAGKKHKIDPAQFSRLVSILVRSEKPSLAEIVREVRPVSLIGEPIHERALYRRIPAARIGQLAARQRGMLRKIAQLEKRREKAAAERARHREAQLTARERQRQIEKQAARLRNAYRRLQTEKEALIR